MKILSAASKRIRSQIAPAFELLYLSCVCLMMLEIAMPLPVSLYKGLYVATFITLGLKLLLKRKLGIKGYITAGRRYLGVLTLFILLFLYILADTVGVLYSPVPDFALSKYLVIIPMLLFFIPTFYYARTQNKLDKLYKTLALSGVLVGLLSLSNYFIFEFMPLAFIRRLSMIADYNRYAENLFVSLILGSFFVLNARFKPRTQTALLFLNLTFHSIIITISGSRRTMILLIPSIAAVLLYKAFYVARYSATERAAFRRLATGALLTVFCVGVVFAAERGFEWYSNIKYQQVLADGHSIPEENSVENVIESIGTGGMFSKRLVIWRVACDEAKTYGLMDILIGRGSGYEVYFYDVTQSKELAAEYSDLKNMPKYWMSPHNFVLADFLSGGIIKLGLSLALMGAVATRLVLLFARRPGRALPLLITMGLLYFNVFISGRYGIVYDKFFYLLFAALAVESVLAARAQQGDALQFKG
ncbi:hypothetical protein [Acetanaerobacterium elongatum]|uniref:O-Antigen ligase n=1 Tax=Acetanaerobacterium elongatum TaxID=258515 RepID=A0A1G9WKU7_9FIRM|nr:hypothetical protein [Acetanaerobacterium elongatum]SDM84665.1 hypothetical protein SAMN05192585_10636 [Acetanaerobacterium elongatum]